MRVILEYELDGIYILKEDFELTQKVKPFAYLIDDILTFAEKICDDE